MVDHLIENDFEVSIITGFPFYPKWEVDAEYKHKPKFMTEQIDGAVVYRHRQFTPKNPTFFKRIIQILDFSFGAMINMFKIKKCDLVISIVPYTSTVLIGHALKRRLNSQLWVHVQDFEFDAAIQTGIGQKNKWYFRWLFWLENWLFAKADVSSSISYSMMEKLKLKNTKNQFFFPNWVDASKIDPNNFQTHRYLRSEKKIILYSGNIGDKQDWITFLEFCKDLDQEKYEVVVVGDGARRDWLVENSRHLSNLKCYPPVPVKELSDLLCSAHIHILFQKQDVIDTVLPSKILGMMASAKPSIIVGNPASEVKEILYKSKGGVFFKKYSLNLIAKMDELINDSKSSKEMGENARKYVIDKFSKKTILNSLLNRIGTLEFKETQI